MSDKKLSLVKETDKVQLLSEVTVPQKFFSRIQFGVEVIDQVFGGQEMPGIIQGSSFLFTGMPGAGKSTMCLQLADLLQRKAGRSVLYNLGEENVYMVKLRSDRLGLSSTFCTGQFGEVDKLINYIKKNGVEVLFQDSLQSLRDGDLRGARLLESVTRKLVKLATEDGVTVFLIGHITKGGQFAGPQAIKHDVDAHAHLRMNKETGNRIFELEKNRFGPAFVPYEFMLSAQGLDFHQLPVSPDDEKATNKAAERRDQIKELIKEKLKAKEKISGYCFERLNVDCSGGFWRGMLAKAVKELVAEGYKLGESKDGPGGRGRAHSYVISAPPVAPPKAVETKKEG